MRGVVDCLTESVVKTFFRILGEVNDDAGARSHCSSDLNIEGHFAIRQIVEPATRPPA